MKQQDPEERIPLFPSWKWWYGVVLINLIIMIGLFYLITRIFS